MKNFRVRVLIALLLFVGSCATMDSKPPIKNPQISKLNLPPAYLITGVPWYRQGRKECGPTSLAMVVGYYGKKVTKDEVARWVMTAGKLGTEIEQLEYYAGQGGIQDLSAL